ncbi:allantoate permease [Kwoniella heveanensis BCC8398]|uniref:Allantoate permease n=1 Tax=Kwoniella heveanensis BCC8398 TaxID=1296120 RepID=A0A1B9GV52_9TREE|nr:allantoate permease [Kwoniella heveanensis BCC8398]
MSVASSTASVPTPTADELARLREAERRVVRKIDILLLPIMLVTYGLQYYDKSVLGTAAVYGILKDLDLTRTINGVTYTTRYSTATAAFYYGYIVAVLPMGLLFARVPLAKAASVCVIIWGLVCILTVVCHNYPGFVAQRVILGFTESAVSPAFVAVCALWWKPQEQAKRIGVFYSATGVFSMFSAMVNIGLGKTGGTHPWKSMYYFCGSLTIFWGFVIWFLMPDTPLRPGRFFNEEEKKILIRRFEENPFGSSQQSIKPYQVIEAVLDVKTWIYLLMGAAIYICNGSVTAFGARIISGFGYTPIQSNALLIPGGFVTVVTIAFFSYFADKYKNIRTWLLPASCIPVVVGALVIWQAPWHPTIGPLIGYYLVASFGAPYVLLLSLATANTAGATKKGVTSGFIFIGYNVGNIAASYLVFSQEKPIKYRSTWIAVIVCMVFASAASIVLRYLYTAENKRRDKLAATTVPEAKPIQQLQQQGDIEKLAEEGHTDVPVVESVAAYQDRTDKERLEFRYTL